MNIFGEKTRLAAKPEMGLSLGALNGRRCKIQSRTFISTEPAIAARRPVGWP
jgi:hypothetical protein